MAARHGIFYNGKEGFYRGCDIRFIDACLLCDLINNVCFRHGAWVLGLAKLICAARIKNNIQIF